MTSYSEVFDVFSNASKLFTFAVAFFGNTYQNISPLCIWCTSGIGWG